VLIRLPPPEGEDGAELGAEAVAGVRDRVLELLRAHEPNVEMRGAANLSSQAGQELFENAGLALLFALIMIFIYVMVRFRWKLAVGAIVATIHDVLVTTGIFAIAGWTFDLTVLGSILAVLGYSINDTIVVYDRIRDNFRLMRRGTPEVIVNASVNQTLARTLVTGVRRCSCYSRFSPRRRRLRLLRGARDRHRRRHYCRSMSRARWLWR
jgi:preprotein translocase subunit SecF